MGRYWFSRNTKAWIITMAVAAIYKIYECGKEPQPPSPAPEPYVPPLIKWNCPVCKQEVSWPDGSTPNRKEFPDTGFMVCADCFENYDQKTGALFTTKGSGRVGSSIVEEFGSLKSDWYKLREAAEQELRYISSYKGANAIMGLRFDSQKRQDGNYIYSVWCAVGDVVLTKRNA